MRCDPLTVSLENPSGLLVVDGVNGAGKSTLISKIDSYLSSRGHTTTLTREPGCAGGIGPEIRRLLLTRDNYSISPLGELFLFAADRTEHVSQVIRPALARGEIVISDRYYYSTTAFQGYGRGLDLNLVQSINNAAIQGMLPDMAIFLDLDPIEGLKRTALRQEDSADTDSFESEKIEFHRRLREGFLKIADECTEPIVVIDATPSPEDVFARITPALDRWLTGINR